MSTQSHVVRRAFTLVELLVVIGIIALLVSILLPVLNKAKKHAETVKCASNLRQVGQAFLIYANDNKGWLPYTTTTPTYWMWDMPKPTVDLIMKAGSNRNIFYCPVYSEQNRDSLWFFGQASYRVLGYGFVNKREGFNPTLKNRMLQDKIDKPRFDPNNAAMPRRPVDIELAFDATISNTAGNDFKGQGAERHDTAHMTKDKPDGGNCLFMDGHVAWRPFHQMELRVNAGPSWWW